MSLEPAPDAARIQRAVVTAKLRYPDGIGDFLANELNVWRNYGYRFETSGRMGRLVDALLETRLNPEA